MLCLLYFLDWYCFCYWEWYWKMKWGNLDEYIRTGMMRRKRMGQTWWGRQRWGRGRGRRWRWKQARDSKEQGIRINQWPTANGTACSNKQNANANVTPSTISFHYGMACTCRQQSITCVHYVLVTIMISALTVSNFNLCPVSPIHRPLWQGRRSE